MQQSENKEELKMDMMQYILIVGGIILLSFVYQGVGMYIHSRAKEKFESENPDASIMIIKDCPWHLLGFTNTITCLTINGEPQTQIAEGFGQRGYYIMPGTNILELQYETQRPGILHKWVRTTYDPQKIEVNVEPKKKYTISYDKNSGFVFTEVTK